MKERDILKACLDALTLLRVLAFRVNVGCVRVGGRFLRFGVRGMADVICFPAGRVLWIETKTATGKQSEFQKSFEQQVIAHGHHYLLARCPEDVINQIAVLEGRQKTTA